MITFFKATDLKIKLLRKVKIILNNIIFMLTLFNFLIQIHSNYFVWSCLMTKKSNVMHAIPKALEVFRHTLTYSK